MMATRDGTLPNSNTEVESRTGSEPIPGIGGTTGRDPVASKMLVGLEDLVAHLYPVTAHQAGMAIEHFDARALEQSLHAPYQRPDDTVFTLDHGRHIEAEGVDLDAEGLGLGALPVQA